MKKFLTICLLAFSFTSAQAAPQYLQKPVQCGTPVDVINEYVVTNNLKAMFIAVANIRTQYGEIVKAPIVFFYNPNSGRFMLMEGNVDETCVIELGDMVDFNVNHDEIIGRYLGTVY